MSCVAFNGRTPIGMELQFPDFQQANMMRCPCFLGIRKLRRRGERDRRQLNDWFTRMRPAVTTNLFTNFATIFKMCSGKNVLVKMGKARMSLN